MDFLHLVIRGVLTIIMVDVLSSWFVRPDQFPRTLTGPITEPLYAPIRKVLDPARTGGVDLAPLIVMIALQLLAQGLAGALA
jgi:uncharacterized protein YggT (Ycf19 family)